MDGVKLIPVKVALRIRPLVKREIEDGCTECIRTVTGAPQIILGKDKSFTYDYVFSQKSPQIEVYETAVQSLLTALFKGYNATVLAYGQTGSGKTHSMGSGNATLAAAKTRLKHNEKTTIGSANFDEVGVIPRVLDDLFSMIEDEQNRNKETKFAVHVSYVEIYNEEINDLLQLNKSGAGVPAEPLNIREENESIRVVGLSEWKVKNAIETIQLLGRGSKSRAVGDTAMNEQSSRSHAIFTITLEQLRGGEQELIKSKFHLVDLAGSERQSKTKAEGMRLKEAININLGLLALGNVISVLGEDNPTNKQRHVPYRESKLTRLLQDSLGGNSHTLMIACVSPADSNMEETINTLRYADRARKIKNKPVVNIDPQAAELANLRQQVKDLKSQNYQLTGGAPATFNFKENSTGMITLKENSERLKAENNKLVAELQRLFNTNRVTYDRLTTLETERKEKNKKFNEIRATFDRFAAQSKVNPESDGTASSALLIEELQAKIDEFDRITEKEPADLVGFESLTLEAEPVDKEFTLRKKEVNQMKALENKRKSAITITKLNEGHHRQGTARRGTGEEISRSHQQLHEAALEKQKQLSYKYLPSSNRKELSSDEKKKLRDRVTQELELSVNLAEARINFNKLIEERKKCTAELATLTKRPTKEHGASANATYIVSPSVLEDSPCTSEEAESRDQLKKKINQLKEQIKCKTIQINNIQQMVIEGDEDNRTKCFFSDVQNLLEAKVLLEHLYSYGVQYLFDLKLKSVQQFETNSSSMSQELEETKKKLNSTKEELGKLKKQRMEEAVQLHQHGSKRGLRDVTNTHKPKSARKPGGVRYELKETPLFCSSSDGGATPDNPKDLTWQASSPIKGKRTSHQKSRKRRSRGVVTRSTSRALLQLNRNQQLDGDL